MGKKKEAGEERNFLLACGSDPVCNHEGEVIYHSKKSKALKAADRVAKDNPGRVVRVYRAAHDVLVHISDSAIVVDLDDDL